VQFVEYKKHEKNPMRLAQEVIKEIPEQLTSYFKSRGFKPLPRRGEFPKENCCDIQNQFSTNYFKNLRAEMVAKILQKDHSKEGKEVYLTKQRVEEFLDNYCLPTNDPEMLYKFMSLNENQMQQLT
jgi:hypothetical protein